MDEVQVILVFMVKLLRFEIQFNLIIGYCMIIMHFVPVLI